MQTLADKLCQSNSISKHINKNELTTGRGNNFKSIQFKHKVHWDETCSELEALFKTFDRARSQGGIMCDFNSNPTIQSSYCPSILEPFHTLDFLIPKVPFKFMRPSISLKSPEHLHYFYVVFTATV